MFTSILNTLKNLNILSYFKLENGHTIVLANKQGDLANISTCVKTGSLNERFGIDLPTEDFQTVGGYIFGLQGREPEIGDEIEANDIKMKVENIVKAILYKEDGFVDQFASEE